MAESDIQVKFRLAIQGVDEWRRAWNRLAADFTRLARRERWDAPDWLILDPPMWRFPDFGSYRRRPFDQAVDVDELDLHGDVRSSFARFLGGGPNYQQEV